MHGALDACAQHIADGDEAGRLVLDDAAIGRDAHFAVCKGVEGIDGFVARHSGCQMYEDFHFLGCVVLHFPYFDFSFFRGFHDGIAERSDGFAEGKFCDGKCLCVALFNACTHLDASSALSVVVF